VFTHPSHALPYVVKRIAQVPPFAPPAPPCAPSSARGTPQGWPGPRSAARPGRHPGTGAEYPLQFPRVPLAVDPYTS
jgi:hypothetical protein